ncbi:MAG: hypothetical protein H6917_19525 [Novosphingobium sp.]|nr:hypothetical protein [Novosphingobium sp.]
MKNRRVFLGGMVITSIAALSACAPKPAPAPPPPRIVIPPRPYPPLGAAPNLVTPPVDVNGVRQTVNVGLTSNQRVWNLRSAYNVAALNCQKPEHAGILEGYTSFLKSHSRELTSVNRELDKAYKAQHGSNYIRVRESFQTQVYNYFAFPPTLPAFCDAVLAMSQREQLAQPSDLDAFAASSLPQLESVFGTFYNSYDQYRMDLAAWEARYGGGSVAGPTAPPSQTTVQ